MNLKEAFRFQNKIGFLLDEANNILATDSNVTKVQNTLLTSKVIKGSEDIVSFVDSSSDFSENITGLCSFVMFLLDEKEKLSDAIQKTKTTLNIDIDSQTALNIRRQEMARSFRRMNNIRSSEKLLTGGGTAYTFNSDGDQTPVICDLKKVTTINFDRNKVKAYLEKLDKTSDEVSRKLDVALVTSNVEYNAPFDVNASLSDVFEEFNAG